MSLLHYCLKQVENGLDCRFSLKVSDNETYEIKLPFGINRRGAHFELNGKEKYRFAVDLSVSRRVRAEEIGSHKSVLFAIKDEKGENVGDIYSCCSKAWFGYEFYAAHLFGREYTAYEIGLGKDGIRIPVYCESIQIAEIHKSPVVINNKDIYDLYLKNHSDLTIVMMMAVYYDLMNFGNNSTISHGREVVYITTKNKELLNKFDPDFISGG